MSQPATQFPSELLSVQSRAEIDHWIAKYPPEQKKSAVIAALTIVQKANGGWLTQALMDAVAEYLELRPIEVYEVATFYSMFERKPVGRHKISICTNISCMLSGAEDIVRHLESRLGIRLGQTTPDGKFTLKEVECLAACGAAPMFEIGLTFHENLTPEKVDAILEGLN